MPRTIYDKNKKLWKGTNTPAVYNPKVSLGQVILRVCKNFGPKIAQISDDSGIQLTFDEMRIKIIRAVQNLQRLGHNSRGVFGVIARNSHQLAPIVFPSIVLGSPVNGIDPSFGKTEFLHMLKTTRPVLLFCDLDVYELLKECLIESNSNAKIFTFGGSKNGSEDVAALFVETHKEKDFMPVEVDGENEPAIIVCSSGTTGLPKGVCISHALLLDRTAHSDTLNLNDVVFCFVSLYGIGGWVMLLNGTMYGATRIITTKSFDADLQLSLIEKYKVTYSYNPPFQLALMMKSDRLHRTNLSSLKHQLTGGAKIPVHLKKEVMSKFKNALFYTVYGLSETAGGISASIDSSDSVGQLYGYCTAKIIDEEGNRCGVGENGEICLKTNYRFLGYYGNQNATDASLDNEGYFLTGDIGHFDANKTLFIIDRKKDLISCNNYQVSPSEIESYLVESLKIKVVCVVGIPDDSSNEFPAAFIERKGSSHVTENDVFNAVAGHFADHCKLRGGVYFVDSLPSTPSGKIIRRKLIELATDAKKYQQKP